MLRACIASSASTSNSRPTGDNVGYLHISNLYRPDAQTIFLFHECYALEKVDGTSAHISWNAGQLHFSAGGASHEGFVKLFDAEALRASFEALGYDKITVFGEAYGGKLRGRVPGRYGKALKFVAFDVKVGDSWLDVLKADQIVRDMDLEFVHYSRVSTDISTLDAARDAPSVQARRNGIEGDQPMEGVVLRPIKEFTDNRGERIISKHKRAEERETQTARKVGDPAKLAVLEAAEAIAAEWVTSTRLEHVLDKLGEVGMKDTPRVIAAMVEDVTREGAGEFVDSRDARKAIGSATARLFKQRFVNDLNNSTDLS
jgi:RNA ligase-like protein